MSIGSLLLMIAAILVFSGLLQRVLDRMHLTDRQALLLIGAMLVGTLLPDISAGSVHINIGGAVIPFAVCVYLFIRADEPQEKWRSVLGSLITAAAICLLSALLPSEAEAMRADPLWLNGLCAGVVAWQTGRSRRAAFICGAAGMLLADIFSAAFSSLQGYAVELHLGSAGIGDAVVISAVVAVLLCELVGEAIERLSRKKKGART